MLHLKQILRNFRRLQELSQDQTFEVAGRSKVPVSGELGLQRPKWLLIMLMWAVAL